MLPFRRRHRQGTVLSRQDAACPATDVHPRSPPTNPMLAALRGDAAFLVLIGKNVAVDFEAALAELDPTRVSTVRIRNPLATPLSPHRMMLQLAPNDGEEDGSACDDAGRLLRAVKARAGGRPSLLVVVEQAETLTAAALALLQLLPELHAPGVPSVRVAFLGSSAFHDLLRDPRFSPIRDHLAHSPLLGDAGAPPTLQDGRWPKRQRFIVAAAFLAVAVALGTGNLFFHHPFPAAPVPIPTQVPAPSSAAAARADPATQLSAAPTPDASQTAAPPLPKATAEDPVAARARLFREFNAFVEARGLAGRLSQLDRETLFQEYLVRRHGAAAGTPSTTVAPAVVAADNRHDVVVLFPIGVPGAEALAARDATLLRQQVQNVTLRPTDRSPVDSEIHYSYPEDRDVAIALALALPPAPGEWQVMHMAGVTEYPSRPTIEVWLPRSRPVP